MNEGSCWDSTKYDVVISVNVDSVAKLNKNRIN